MSRFNQIIDVKFSTKPAIESVLLVG